MGKHLLARDTVNGAEGKIFITRNGRNVEVAGMNNIETDIEIQSSEMKTIGSRVTQDKPTGVKQTGKGNIYYGSNLFKDMVLEYINTGVMPEFDIQITNNDPAASIGRQVAAYYGCHLTGNIPLSILNSEDAMMRYDFTFVWTRVSVLEAFTEPTSYGG